MFTNQRQKRLISWGLLILAFIVLSEVAQGAVRQPWWERLFTQGRLHVYFLDVGQGDATLIRTPQGKNILIDAGPDLSVVYRLGEVLPFYERVIDLVILTHPDQDHILGLLEIFNRYQIEQVMTTPLNSNSPVYELIKQSADSQGIVWQEIAAGDNFWIDGILFEILYPEKSFITSIIDQQDNNIFSLVIKVVFQQVSFLFSGDLPKEEELSLVNENTNLSAGVLQAGHHGSKTSTSLEWLRAVKPKYVVVSVGVDNRFGHPHYRVLRDIERVGAKILRTDREGTIIFVSNGEDIIFGKNSFFCYATF